MRLEAAVEIKARLQDLRDRAGEWLQQQVWYNQLRDKWGELDAETQRAVKAAVGVLGALAFLAFAGSMVWSVRSLKQELSEKRELLSALQAANDEMRRLRDGNQGVLSQGDAAPNWQNFVDGIAGTAGIDKDAWSVSNERASDADTGSDAIKATLFEVTLKHVNIRQVVKMAHGLETGARPARVKMLSIDTAPDGSGYLGAQLLVLGYQVGGSK